VLDSTKKDKIMKLVILCGQYSRLCSVLKMYITLLPRYLYYGSKRFKISSFFYWHFGLRLQFCT